MSRSSTDTTTPSESLFGLPVRRMSFFNHVWRAAVLISIGTLAYSFLEGWSYLNAFYFSSNCLTSTGMADNYPKTSAGKAFTIAYLLCGVGYISLLLGDIANNIIAKMRRFQVLRNMDGLSHTIAMLALYLIFGMLLFSYLEGLDYLDACYVSASALSTAGFGDIPIKSAKAKVAMVVYSFAGIGVFSVMASNLKYQFAPLKKL